MRRMATFSTVVLALIGVTVLGLFSAVRLGEAFGLGTIGLLLAVVSLVLRRESKSGANASG